MIIFSFYYFCHSRHTLIIMKSSLAIIYFVCYSVFTLLNISYALGYNQATLTNNAECIPGTQRFVSYSYLNWEVRNKLSVPLSQMLTSFISACLIYIFTMKVAISFLRSNTRTHGTIKVPPPNLHSRFTFLLLMLVHQHKGLKINTHIQDESHAEKFSHLWEL